MWFELLFCPTAPLTESCGRFHSYNPRRMFQLRFRYIILCKPAEKVCKTSQIGNFKILHLRPNPAAWKIDAWLYDSLSAADILRHDKGMSYWSSQEYSFLVAKYKFDGVLSYHIIIFRSSNGRSAQITVYISKRPLYKTWLREFRCV